MIYHGDKIRSRLETTKDGLKLLWVWYPGDGYYRAIEEGLTKYGLKHGDCHVVCMPESLRHVFKARGGQK